jgi:hypothetical protein
MVSDDLRRQADNQKAYLAFAHERRHRIVEVIRKLLAVRRPEKREPRTQGTVAGRLGIAHALWA